MAEKIRLEIEDATKAGLDSAVATYEQARQKMAESESQTYALGGSTNNTYDFKKDVEAEAAAQREKTAKIIATVRERQAAITKMEEDAAAHRLETARRLQEAENIQALQSERRSREILERTKAANQQFENDKVLAAQRTALIINQVREQQAIANNTAIANQVAGARQLGVASKGAGQGLLQLGYAIDDVQYGLRGVVNNVPMLVQSLGAGAGLAGVAAIAAVAVSQLESKTQIFSKTWETVAPTLVNPWTAFTKGAQSARAEMELSAAKAEQLKDEAAGRDKGKQLQKDDDVDQDKKKREARLKQIDDLRVLENTLRQIKFDLETGKTDNFADFLGESFDQKDAAKNRENVAKFRDAVRARIEERKREIAEAKKLNEKATDELIQEGLAKDAADAEHTRRELDRIAEVNDANRERFHDDLELFANREKLIATEQERSRLIERQNALRNAGVTTDNDGLEIAGKLKQIDAERIRLLEDAQQSLQSVEDSAKNAYESSVKNIRLVGKEGIEQAKNEARLKKDFEEAAAARKKNDDALEKEREAQKLAAAQRANRLNLEWDKQLAEQKKKHDAEEKQRKADLEAQRQEIVNKIKQELVAADPRAGGANLFQQFNAGISDRDVAKRALQNRQQQGREAFLENLRNQGEVDDQGRAIGGLAQQRQQDAAWRKAQAAIGAQFARDARGGQAGDELANAREQLIQGNVVGLQLAGRLNREQGQAILEMAAERRKQTIEAANLQAQIAGIRKAIQGGRGGAAKPGQVAPNAVDAGNNAADEIEKRNAKKFQAPLFFDGDEQANGEVGQRRANANQAAAAVAGNVNAGLAKLGDAQGEADAAQLDALNAVAGLLTEQAKRQAQLHDVVAQITQHVNQLQQQFLAADDAAMARALKAGAV